METDRPQWTPPAIGTAMGRAFRRQCPRCGGAAVFDNWLRLKEHCPTCDLRFERIDGYWLGSMVINLAVTQVLLLAALVGLLIATWPDVPWTGVLIAVVTIAVVVPLLVHPLSRLLWVAGERHFHLRSHPDATD
jgi:uncharacterized protein (DUF983 family)